MIDPEVEAAAVLRSLGGPLLEWSDFNGLLLSNDVVNSVDGYACQYEVSSNRRRTRFYTRCLWIDIVYARNPAMLATEDDAKAACEFHYATGRWE